MVRFSWIPAAVLFLAFPALAQQTLDERISILEAIHGLTNGAPTALIAGPATGDTGVQVLVDACISTDPDGDTLTFAWTLQVPPGSVSALSNTAACNPTFTPDIDGDYIPGVTVSDPEPLSDAASYTFIASTPVQGGNTFDDLIAKPGVIMSENFDTGLGGCSVHDASGSAANPQVTATLPFEGSGSLEMTANDAAGQDWTGSIDCSFPEQTSGTFYLHFQVRYGGGLMAKIQNNEVAHGSGMKIVQVTNGASCSTNSVNFADGWGRGIFQGAYSCGGQGMVIGEDKQPPNQCWKVDGAYRNNPNCTVIDDDVWYNFEVEVTIGSPGRVKWFVNDHPVVDFVRSVGEGLEYDKVWLTGYMTNHGSGSNGLFPLWYDNLIVSTDCITSCGL